MILITIDYADDAEFRLQRCQPPATDTPLPRGCQLFRLSAAERYADISAISPPAEMPLIFTIIYAAITPYAFAAFISFFITH
jgi:hypothetical protein